LGDLEVNGFTLNPYDPCVANKMVNEKQFTITWHVDDLKLSHMDDKEVTKMIVWLKSIYGDDIRVSRGKKHDNLGMDLNVPGQFKITMIPYLKGVIRDFPEEITGRATSAAADHLFTVREDQDREPLDESRALAFHHTVAQLMFACPRARKDLQTAVAFLTTRVRSPYEDDWEKLKRVLRYLKSTINLPLILRADNLNIIKWWVDASYACHGDCRGHTGATMSVGKCSVLSM
jgi:hypothetical protein